MSFFLLLWLCAIAGHLLTTSIVLSPVVVGIQVAKMTELEMPSEKGEGRLVYVVHRIDP
jgi:hypothetical protein